MKIKTTLDAIMLIEGGDATAEEIYEAMQLLIDNGVVFSLQGMYGRMASQLIASGNCTPPEAR